jgi:hypothetical protein
VQALVGEPDNGIIGSHVVWDSEPVAMTANEALAADAAGAETRTLKAEAEEFLREMLVGGPVAQKEIKVAAEGAGLSLATVRRAKNRLGIKPEKAGMEGGWLWSLPKMLKSAEGAHLLNVSTFGTDEHLRASADVKGGEESRVCVQCGGIHGQLRQASCAGRDVWIHRECERAWLSND